MSSTQARQTQSALQWLVDQYARHGDDSFLLDCGESGNILKNLLDHSIAPIVQVIADRAIQSTTKPQKSDFHYRFPQMQDAIRAKNPEAKKNLNLHKHKNEICLFLQDKGWGEGKGFIIRRSEKNQNLLFSSAAIDLVANRWVHIVEEYFPGSGSVNPWREGRCPASPEAALYPRPDKTRIRSSHAHKEHGNGPCGSRPRGPGEKNPATGAGSQSMNGE